MSIKNEIKKQAEKLDQKYVMYQLPEERIACLEQALIDRSNASMEMCAKLCEENDEVTVLATGKRRLDKKTSTNVNGFAYADGIRALKEKP